LREVPDAIAALAREVQNRQGASTPAPKNIYVFIYGLQRYRVLRHREDDFSFSSVDSEAPPAPDKQFGELLREGPPLGIHTLAWCDTPPALDRTLDRQARTEFGGRVLFQMSATDSSNLIDSPAANKLGFYRALLSSEELGLLEKFRPYARLDEQWLQQVKKELVNKTDADNAKR
jgi:hypothetical protein